MFLPHMMSTASGRSSGCRVVLFPTSLPDSEAGGFQPSLHSGAVWFFMAHTRPPLVTLEQRCSRLHFLLLQLPEFQARQISLPLLVWVAKVPG